MSPFSPFPIFSMAVVDPPPPPGPMPIPAANKTFRKAVLPVLCELDIHYRSETMSVPAANTTPSLEAIFNFNNPTWFIGIESTLLSDITVVDDRINIRTRARSQNSPFPITPDPSLGTLLSNQNLSGDKGIKIVTGLPMSPLAGVVAPSGPFWHYKLIITPTTPENPTDIDPSSFHKLLFIGANPANPQTLVYDIVA